LNQITDTVTDLRSPSSFGWQAPKKKEKEEDEDEKAFKEKKKKEEEEIKLARQKGVYLIILYLSRICLTGMAFNVSCER
jgi:hypothetical protein